MPCIEPHVLMATNMPCIEPHILLAPETDKVQVVLSVSCQSANTVMLPFLYRARSHHPQDVYGAVERIKAEGGKVTREAGPVKGGSTVIAFVKDPSGYLWELLQRGDTPEPLCQVSTKLNRTPVLLLVARTMPWS